MKGEEEMLRDVGDREDNKTHMLRRKKGLVTRKKEGNQLEDGEL